MKTMTMKTLFLALSVCLTACGGQPEPSEKNIGEGVLNYIDLEVGLLKQLANRHGGAFVGAWSNADHVAKKFKHQPFTLAALECEKAEEVHKCSFLLNKLKVDAVWDQSPSWQAWVIQLQDGTWITTPRWLDAKTPPLTEEDIRAELEREIRRGFQVLPLFQT